MGILAKQEIIERLNKGELLSNAFEKEDGTYDVEPASYDLHAGTAIWKEVIPSSGKSKIRKIGYDIPASRFGQEVIHLQPGQVMFIITREEVKMPKELCGTVYAKNKFSREGILALTTGHIDPGVHCPIVIRLINLRSIPYTFQIGDPIYTIVFNTLEVHENMKLEKHQPITMETTIANTMLSADASLANAFNDISLTREFIRKDEFLNNLSLTGDFIKKDEFGKLFVKTLFSTIWGYLLIIFAILGALAALAKILDYIK